MAEDGNKDKRGTAMSNNFDYSIYENSIINERYLKVCRKLRNARENGNIRIEFEDIRPNDFFAIVNFCKSEKMVTWYKFRIFGLEGFCNFCSKVIGIETLNKIMCAVDETTLPYGTLDKRTSDLIRALLREFKNQINQDCYLVNQISISREVQKAAELEKIRQQELHDKAEHEAAVAKRKAKKDAIDKNNEFKNAERDVKIAEFNSKDFEGQMRMVAELPGLYPGYYPIDFKELDEAKLEELSDEVLDMLVDRFADAEKGPYAILLKKCLKVKNERNF